MLQKLFGQNKGFNKVTKNKVNSEWMTQDNINNNEEEEDNDNLNPPVPQNITYEVETFKQINNAQYGSHERDKALNYIANELDEAEQKINALSIASKQNKKKKKKYKKIKAEKYKNKKPKEEKLKTSKDIKSKKKKKYKDDKIRSKSMPNIPFRKEKKKKKKKKKSPVDFDFDNENENENENEYENSNSNESEESNDNQSYEVKQPMPIQMPMPTQNTQCNDYWNISSQNENDYLWLNDRNMIGLKRRNKKNNRVWISCIGKKVIKRGDFMRWDINILSIDFDSKKSKKNKKNKTAKDVMIGIVDIDTVSETGRSIMGSFWVLPYFGYGFGGEKGKKYHIASDGYMFSDKYKIGDVVSVELNRRTNNSFIESSNNSLNFYTNQNLNGLAFNIDNNRNYVLAVAVASDKCVLQML